MTILLGVGTSVLQQTNEFAGVYKSITCDLTTVKCDNTEITCDTIYAIVT